MYKLAVTVGGIVWYQVCSHWSLEETQMLAEECSNTQVKVAGLIIQKVDIYLL